VIASAANIIVQASEAWPVVAAGLGSAVIVAGVSLLVARKQRTTDTKGLDKQLAHDRTMRAKQQEIDAVRFEMQLEHDRKLRQLQNDAESKRLDRQLDHDREMRDLRHLRETLAPMVARLVDWDAFLSLHMALATAGDANPGQRSAITQLASDVGNASEQLRRDSRTLIVLAGPAAPIASRLREVANDGETLIHLAKQWTETGTMTPDIAQALPPLLAKYGQDHSRFLEAANEAVRWGETDTYSTKPIAG
jgi:hypothetical protein